MKSWFKSVENSETGTTFTLDEIVNNLTFDDQGLLPVICQDHETKDVLMFAWMNREALKETLSEGRMCYWSRSRQSLWRKGESSGHWQTVKSLRIDCDGDVLLAMVDQTGAACHTNRRSCFYFEIDGSEVSIKG